MTEFAENDRLSRVTLVEDRPRARTPEIQQELDVALFDLSDENQFKVAGNEAGGPYHLGIGMAERLLQMNVTSESGEPITSLHLSLSPLRSTIKDYFQICESYFDAVKRLPPSKIEAIDMGRRGIHDEGARILTERLDGKVVTDHATARRLFTVICALQFRG
ncbi:UPF0262 family protein [Rhodobacteraceae bacterium NNCM2]|nr:UPF0262 family protein [Coraliihabitans acroporae]